MSKFNLEQELLSCWHITDDLYLLLKECESIENSETADRISNIVLGLKSVYEMRFQKTWDTFEDLLKEGKL